MATARILASYDEQGAENDQGSTSGIEPTAEGAVYFDPITGQEIKAANGADLLALVQQQLGGFVSKEDLKEQIQAGKLSGDIRKTSGDEWDCIVFDLSNYPDPAKARETILEALANPNYKAKKNQGGGRFQDVEVKGKRGVIGWGVHDAQNGIGPHFHAFVHYHAIDGTQVCPRATMKDTHIEPMEMKAINDALAEQGMAPITLLGKTQTAATPQAKAAQAAVANSVATGAELPPPVAGVAPTLSEVKLSFGEMAAMKQAEAAKLYQQAQALAKESAIYEQAQQATNQYQKIAKERDQTQAAFDELQENHHKLAKIHHQTHNEREALALAICNTLGLEEDKASLPAAELEKLAGQAFDEQTRELREQAEAERKAREEAEQKAQQEAGEKQSLVGKVAELEAKHAAFSAILEETGLKSPDQLKDALIEAQHKSADLDECLAQSGHASARDLLDAYQNERVARGATRTELESVQRREREARNDNGRLRTENGQLRDDMKGKDDELAKLRKELEAERKAKAEEIRKAEERAAKDAEKKAKDEAREAIKMLQKSNSDLTKKAAKDQDRASKAEGALEATKQALAAANKQNAEIMKKLSAAAPKKPAGPK